MEVKSIAILVITVFSCLHSTLKIQINTMGFIGRKHDLYNNNELGSKKNIQ